MLVNQFIQPSFATVNYFDTVAVALQLIEDNDVLHLPVLHLEKCKGIISKQALLDANENDTINNLEARFITAWVIKDAYFFSAINILTQHQTTVVAVITEQFDYLGIITIEALMNYVSVFIGNNDAGGIVVLETEKIQFSFGEISRLIETNDAYITQLNTSINPETGLLWVAIKINKSEISDIVATLQRYDYSVKYYFGVEQFANQLKENYNEFMFYLNI